MLLSVVVLPTSAATSTTDQIRYNVNKIEVTTYQELMTALETKSEETNPADLYVVVQNDIKDEWDGYTDIVITYPGNVTLDLNGHKVIMKSPNGDSMFWLKGENPTNFTIINTGKDASGNNEKGTIIFRSDSAGSSVILSQNINATINIIGRNHEYSSDTIGSNGGRDNDIEICMEYANWQTEDKGYKFYTIYLQKINQIYISNTCLDNDTATAYNLFVDETKEGQYYPVTITGKSELLNREYDLQGVNVYFTPRAYNGSRYDWLGSCYIEGGEEGNTTYQSISAIVNNSDKLTWKSVLIDNSGVPYGSTAMPDKTAVYNFNYKDTITPVTDSTANIDTYKGIYVRRTCCDGDYAETTREVVTQLGHIYRCNACDGARTYDFHNFRLTSRGIAATCIKKGISEKYECNIGDCEYYKGETILPLDPNNHNKDRLYTKTNAALPTCTKAGNTAEVICLDCEALVQKFTRLPATGHTEAIDKAVAATCTTPGVTEGKHCSVCGETIVKQKVISPCHSYGEWTVKTAATCTKEGTKERTCLACGATEALSIDKLPHDYTSAVTTKATCTKEGVMTYKCKNCTDSYTKPIAKTAHSYKTTVTKATTSKNGSKVTKCTVCGAVQSTVTIAKVSKVKLNKTSFTYNGKTQKPTVTVTDANGKTLKQGTDYTVKYSKGRKNVGQYTVTVTFKGNYSGTKKLTFKIVPKGTSISKLTAGKKQFTVKWSKQTKQTTGYEIQYSTSKKMKNAKIVTVTKNSTTSKTIKKLKASKTYYVRIRTYKTVDGVKIYSAWSSIKNIKTKK